MHIKTIFKIIVMVAINFNSYQAYSYTVPVIDGVRASEASMDMMSALSALTELISEFSNELTFVYELNELRKMIKETDQLIDSIQDFKDDIVYVKEFNMYRYNSLSEKIRSLTGLVKRVSSLASAVGGSISSESLNSVVNILRYERERAEEQFKAKMAIDELKHQSHTRKILVRKEIERRNQAIIDYNFAKKNKNKWSL